MDRPASGAAVTPSVSSVRSAWRRGDRPKARSVRIVRWLSDLEILLSMEPNSVVGICLPLGVVGLDGGLDIGLDGEMLLGLLTDSADGPEKVLGFGGRSGVSSDNSCRRIDISSSH